MDFDKIAGSMQHFILDGPYTQEQFDKKKTDNLIREIWDEF